MTLHDELLTAELNELYYRERANHWGRLDRVSRALSAFVGTAAVVSLLGLVEGERAHAIAAGLTGVAALLNVAATVWQFSDRARHLQELAAHWSDLAGQVRLAMVGQEPTSPAAPDLIKRAGELQGRDTAPPDNEAIKRLTGVVVQRHGLGAAA